MDGLTAWPTLLLRLTTGFSYSACWVHHLWAFWFIFGLLFLLHFKFLIFFWFLWNVNEDPLPFLCFLQIIILISLSGQGWIPCFLCSCLPTLWFLCLGDRDEAFCQRQWWPAHEPQAGRTGWRGFDYNWVLSCGTSEDSLVVINPDDLCRCLSWLAFEGCGWQALLGSTSTR